MTRALLLFTALIFLALPAVAAGGGPSFDCKKATAPDEKTICASPELSELDLIIAEAYRGYAPEFGEARAIARALLADRRACGADAACIAAAQYNALDTYVGIGVVRAWIPRYVEALMLRKGANQDEPLPPGTDQPMPARLGQCASTKITALTTRFGDPLEGADEFSGVAVEYKNGGRQVSYGAVEALTGSKVGQGVAICLLAIPRDCPPGDTRGRLYLGLNLFTQGSWVLTDTQHMCGGA